MIRAVLTVLVVALAACGTTRVYDYDEPVPGRGAEHGQGRGRGGPEAGRPGVVEARCERHLDLIMATATRHRLDWTLLAAITTVESKWNPQAKNRSGASGLMQVMPSTGRRLDCGNLLDAGQNAACGARLMARLLTRYDGQVPYALAAYAAGAKSVDAAYKAGHAPPKERFVSRVMAFSRAFGDRGCRAVTMKL